MVGAAQPLYPDSGFLLNKNNLIIFSVLEFNDSILSLQLVWVGNWRSIKLSSQN